MWRDRVMSAALVDPRSVGFCISGEAMVLVMI
jgi:hypothetical protein